MLGINIRGVRWVLWRKVGWIFERGGCWGVVFVGREAGRCGRGMSGVDMCLGILRSRGVLLGRRMLGVRRGGVLSRRVRGVMGGIKMMMGEVRRVVLEKRRIREGVLPEVSVRWREVWRWSWDYPTLIVVSGICMHISILVGRSNQSSSHCSETRF
jgi:hypothetical protein